MLSDDAPTPKLTQRNAIFRSEALAIAEELGAVAMMLSRDPERSDIEEANYALAIRRVLESSARRFDKWQLGNVSSERKQHQLMQLKTLRDLASQFIEEHSAERVTR